MAFVLSDGGRGSKRMGVGRPNATFADLTGALQGAVTTRADGSGELRCVAAPLRVQH
jgi:alpha-amylase